jgi:dTDP-4-amino-4,6-dideoxygalactose transaminase
VGVREGDEVIVPRLDWPSNRAAVLSLGAIPIVSDVSETRFTLHPQTLAKRITKKTKAVIVTHLHGVAADMEAINRVAGGAIAVLEDCAQAFGCECMGKPTGTFSDISVFSFGPNKTIDIGEGGMLCARDWDLFERAIRVCAHPTRQVAEGVVRPCFDALSVRPHPLAAALLAARLGRWDGAAAIEAHEALAAGLREIDGIRVIGDGLPLKNSAPYVPVWARDADRILRRGDLRCAKSGAYDIGSMRPDGGNILLLRRNEASD